MKNPKKSAVTKAQDEGESKGGVREEIAKMLEGKDEDVLKAVKDAVEGVLNPTGDAPPADDEDETKEEGAEDDPCPHCGTELGLKEKDKDKGEDEDDDKDKPKDDKPKGKDEDEPKTKAKDKKCGDEDEPVDGNPAGDAKPAMDMKEVMREIAHRDRIADGVADIIGAFDHSEMTVQEVATYACDKLEVPKDGDCVARIEGYIAARRKNAVPTVAEDAAESSDFITKYLNPEK